MFSTRSARRSRLAASVLCLGVSGPVLAGDLNPPAGPVAPTAKPLAELEPRRLINLTNTPGDADSLYRISQPGSYYLGANVTGVSGKHGIKIAASPVTIDLNGFAVSGVPGSLSGIIVSGSHSGTVVMNGHVVEWGQSGIDLVNSLGGRIGDVTARINSQSGIISGKAMSLERCVATGNGNVGIQVREGSVASSCTAQSNLNTGISLFRSRAENCVSNQNSASGFLLDGSTITSCSARQNSDIGIAGSGNSRFYFCTSDQNAGPGFAADGLIDGCAATGNAVYGIALLGGTVTDCIVTNNGFHGIEVSNAPATIRGNHCIGNGTQTATGAGIRIITDGCRIESNTIHGNDIGISITSQVNLVIGNSCRANSAGNFEIVANNRVGPIIVPPLSGVITGNTGAAGLGTTDPWANIAY